MLLSLPPYWSSAQTHKINTDSVAESSSSGHYLASRYQRDLVPSHACERDCASELQLTRRDGLAAFAGIAKSAGTASRALSLARLRVAGGGEREKEEVWKLL